MNNYVDFVQGRKYVWISTISTELASSRTVVCMTADLDVFSFKTYKLKYQWTATWGRYSTFLKNIVHQHSDEIYFQY